MFARLTYVGSTLVETQNFPEADRGHPRRIAVFCERSDFALNLKE